MWKRLLTGFVGAALKWLPYAIPVFLYKLFEDLLLEWIDVRITPGFDTVREPLSQFLHWLSENPLFSAWPLAALFLLVIAVQTCFGLPSREQGIVLEPSGGPESDMHLRVRNLGPSTIFRAHCRLLSGRGENNPTRAGLFRLGWAEFQSPEIAIPAKSSRNLVLAQSRILGDTDAPFGQLDVLEWTQHGEQPFMGTRWRFKVTETLPKFDVQVSLTRNDAGEPHIRMFTVRPRGPIGPLEIVPLPDRRKSPRPSSVA